MLALSDLFAEAAIRTALLAAPAVRRLAPRPVNRLPDLLRQMDRGAARVPELCVSVPADSLTRFALVAADAEGVAVRLGLPGAGPCREQMTELMLRLPRRAVLPAARGLLAAPLCQPPAELPPLRLQFAAGNPAAHDLR